MALSLYINILGALTTAQIPPKQEAQYLSTHIPYTYKYNQQLIKNDTSSLAYHLLFSDYVTPQTYFYLYLGLLLVGLTGLFIYSLFEKP